MASSKATEWGWFFMRLGAGLIFLGLGLKGWHSSGDDVRSIAQLAAGGAALLGLFVRPCVLFLLVATAWLTVSSKGVSLRLVYAALTPLLFAVGLLVGGGGTVLALGAMISGFKGKWWQ